MNQFTDTKDNNSRLLGQPDIKEDTQPISVDPAVEIETDKVKAISEIEQCILHDKYSPFIDLDSVFDGGHIISNWKRYKRMTARIVKIYTSQVHLDCLIDEDKEIYQPKIVAKHLLENVTLIEGNYLLFNYYKKVNEWRIEVLDDQRLFSKNQFPEIDFNAFEDSKFFKED